jgi:hypothetical protein
MEKKRSVIATGITSLRLEYLRNGKKESSLKDALPSQVRLIIAVDGKDSEYYFRIATNFEQKPLIIRGINEPV